LPVLNATGEAIAILDESDLLLRVQESPEHLPKEPAAIRLVS
jgi:hypothetical protein